MKHSSKKRFLSMFLSVALLVGIFATPAYAVPEEQEPQAPVIAEEQQAAEVVEEVAEAPEADNTQADIGSLSITIETPLNSNITLNGTEIMAAADAAVAGVDTSQEVDTSEPSMQIVEAELDNITVLDEATSEPVLLTEEQKAQALGMYQMYLDHWKKNADVLGVQMPFYLQYNDNEDGLGILGEMLVLAGLTVDDVRSGLYKFEDLTGMIMNFMYGDQLGVEFYGEAIRTRRDEAMQAVIDSGAETEYQKLLVLNDWLATINSFDMSYIMNAGGETPVMMAQEATKHVHYDDVYDVLYADYTDQIKASFEAEIRGEVTKVFHDQVYEGIKGNFYKQYYEGYIANLGLGENESPTDEQKAEADAFANDAVATAEKDGVEVAPGVTMTFEEMTQQELASTEKKVTFDESGKIVIVESGGMYTYSEFIDMTVQTQMESEDPVDIDKDGTLDMPISQAIVVLSQQAAAGLTDGVLNYWEGSHIGAFGEGKTVCLGYSKAFSYLVQYMHPEIYGVDGADTDMTVAANWKSAADLYYNENGEIDIEADYCTDLVRISYDASVTMFGEVQDNFNSDHFWNAAKVDGQWYYIDPCYNDVYTEVMIRDRVETDGNINHMYFMFSHTTAANLYEGNYSVIKTLYETAATDQTYEDAWFSRAKSHITSDAEAFYYIYDSTDTISMLEDYNNNSGNIQDLMNKVARIKLVRHGITDIDNGDGDTDYDTLVEFNYSEEETEELGVARVYNPESKEMEENELLTTLYAAHTEQAEIYPSIAITSAYYNGKVYFNLSTCILSYEIESGNVELEKQYTTTYGLRDTTNAFGGMSFSLISSPEGANFTFENHPIAGILLRGEHLTVSIATNMAYISGKDDGVRSLDNGNYTADSEASYGYEFEESNFNTDYSNYSMGDYDDSMLEMFGYTKEINDNDEFMWVANLVGVEALVGMQEEVGLEYQSLEHDHHYLKYDETYFTKTEEGTWNTGFCYVCTVCGKAVEEPVEPTDNDMWGSTGTSYEDQMAQYELDKAEYDAIVEAAGHTYEPADPVWSQNEETGEWSVTFQNLICSSVCDSVKHQKDCLLGDESITIALEAQVIATAELTETTGNCADGLTSVFTASGETEGGIAYTAVHEVKGEAGVHAYEGKFTWTETEEESGYTVVADLTCTSCKAELKDQAATVTVATTEPTCTAEGKITYTATVYAEDETTPLATETKEEVLPVTEHTYGEDNKCTGCGADIGVAGKTVEVVSAYSKDQTSVKVSWKALEHADGYEVFRATTQDAADWDLVKTITSDKVEAYTNAAMEEIQYRNVGLDVGTTYFYKVRAYKGSDENPEERQNSEFSTVVYMPSAVLFDGPYSNSTSRIRLLWKEVAASTGYQIWRLEEDGTWKIVKTLGDRDNKLVDNQGKTTAYSNTGLEAGKTYTYKMRAFAIVEEGKKVFGAYSDEYKVAVMPEAVTLEGKKAAKAGIANLSWNKANGAAGYQIWMSEAKDGTYKVAKSVTDPSVTSYDVRGLSAGKTYYFKARAYVEVDGKKTFGAYSNVVSVPMN